MSKIHNDTDKDIEWWKGVLNRLLFFWLSLLIAIIPIIGAFYILFLREKNTGNIITSAILLLIAIAFILIAFSFK